MDKQNNSKFSGAVGIFVRTGTALEFLLAFLIVVPLTLWFAWKRHSTIAELVVSTLFCLSFVWLNVSILRWQRGLRRMGWSSPGRVSFGLGPRPEDPDELDIWNRGAHFRNSFVAVLLCMLAFGITKWLNGG
jgi:hypothetical protein